MKEKKRKHKNNIQPEIYKSEIKKLDITKLENDFYRADLIIHGLDHSGPSYEGRVFINNPDANHKTSDESSQGYIGSFFVFGHGGCLGNAGHCEVRRPFTRFNMIPNQLLPEKMSLIITDKLKELGKSTDKFTFTIVPRLSKGSDKTCQDADLEKVVKLDGVTIETYDKDEE